MYINHVAACVRLVSLLDIPKTTTTKGKEVPVGHCRSSGSQKSLVGGLRQQDQEWVNIKQIMIRIYIIDM